MGFYLDKTKNGDDLPAKGKVEAILADGGEIVDAEYQPDLLCVIEGEIFDAAAYCYSKEEFEFFLNDGSGRKKTFIRYKDVKNYIE